MTTPDAAQFDLDAVGIGEGQVRLTTDMGVPLEQAHSLSVYVSGTEGNVLSLLARLGNRTGIATALPDGPLGRLILCEYREAGIDTSHVILRRDGRVALYFVEQCSPPISSHVTYDRGHSCFAELGVDDIDWDFVLSGRLIHTSGITAALGDGTYDIVQTALKLARAKGRITSIDINYRAHIWGADDARRKLEPLVALADVVFCSRRDAETVFHLRGETPQIAAAIADRYGPGSVIISDGPGAIVAITDGKHLTALPPPTAIVDRIGAGDALVGGFLHGVLQGDASLGLQLGVAAAALALTRRGDQVHTTVDDLTRLAATLGTAPDILR